MRKGLLLLLLLLLLAAVTGCRSRERVVRTDLRREALEELRDTLRITWRGEGAPEPVLPPLPPAGEAVVTRHRVTAAAAVAEKKEEQREEAPALAPLPAPLARRGPGFGAGVAAGAAGILLLTLIYRMYYGKRLQ